MKPTWKPGERAVEVSPRFETEVDDPTPRRVNFVAGRALTAQALEMEQAQRDRRFALLGRAMVPGIIQGLEVRLVSGEPGAAEVLVSAGSGITHDGEDVVLHRPLSALLSQMRPANGLIEEDDAPMGLVILSLKPVRARSAFAHDPEDPCALDPDAHAYEDPVLVDGVELVWSRLDRGEPVSTRPPTPLAIRDLQPPRLVRPRLDILPVRPTLGGDLSRRRVLLPPRPLSGQPSARAIALTKLRNEAAYRVFAEELETASRGEPPRWAEHGLPVALAQISREGEVIFLDRFAVARMGGAPRRAAPSDRMGVPLPLRRARFDQFTSHIQDLRAEGAPLAPATQHFRTLPPVGVLPATLIDFPTMRSEFFPPNYKVEAAPIPIEQMEAILAARSGLEPYVFGPADYVQILVPVPEYLYEPRLLMKEEMSPVFQQAIDETNVKIATFETYLEHLSGLETAVIGLVDVHTVTDPAPERLPLPVVATSAALGTRRIIPDFEERARDIIRDLSRSMSDLPLGDDEKDSFSLASFDNMITRVSLDNVDRNDLNYQGLKRVIDIKKDQVAKADDFIDMSFVRLQADIYRARKHLVGEDDATRLATSPVLANLASTTTGVETADLIRRFFTDQRTGKSKPVPNRKLNLPPIPDRTSDTPRGDAPVMMTLKPNFQFLAMKMTTPQVSATSFRRAQIMAPAMLASSLAKSVSSKTSVRSTTAITPAAVVGSQFATLKYDLASARVNARSIAWQALAYSKGSPVRTLTVAERLRHSPAQEAKNAAVVTKAEIAQGLQRTGLNLEGLLLPVTAERTVLVREADLQAYIAGGDKPSQAVINVITQPDAAPLEDGIRVFNEAHLVASADILSRGNQNTVAELKAIMPKLFGLRIGLDFEQLPGMILSDRLDPDPENPDEGAYYAAAVDALESAVSMLRLAESRVHAYSTFLDRAQEALIQGYDLAESWQGMVEEIEARLAEARHDNHVASALYAEEDARLREIEQRRLDILEKNVELIAFARPRTVDRFADAPGLNLYAPFETPIPGCLESDRDPPEELEEMLEDLREAPIGWFTDLADEIAPIDKARRLRDAWERARIRAQDWLRRYQVYAERIGRAARQRRVAGKAATGVRLALASSRARWAAIMQSRAELPMAELSSLGWRALRDRATHELSMEDLAAAGKAGRALAREGLDELDRIGSVAACFLDTLGQVPAAIRLQWAETLSVHDTPPDLSDIHNAPLWGRIAFEDRRMLEHLHQWLFSRVDVRNPDARAAMSEIVRVCLLLSSHAPVSEIVEGEAEGEKLLAPGDTFQVAVGRGEAGVGMVATFQDRQKRGYGVVDDMVGSKAVVRITFAPDGPVSVGPATGVRFAKPVRRTLLRRARR